MFIYYSVLFIVPILVYFPKRFGSFCNPSFGQVLV